MNPLKPLIILAIAANLLTLVLFRYAASESGGGAAMSFGFIWMPVLWIITFCVMMIIVVKNRKVLLQKERFKLLAICIFFCTPLPLLLILNFALWTKSTQLISTSMRKINGKVYKTENWYYTDDPRKDYVEMHFVADSLEEATIGDKAFRKDSVWVYFNKAGDTMKIEQYKAGELISSSSIREN